MKYGLIGTTMPAVEITLSRGEAIYTQSGAMAWMSEGIHMDTNMKGGLLKGLGRMFSGESLFMVTYTAQRDRAAIGFSATVPGEILAMDLTGTKGFICQKGCFLCAEPSIELAVALTKRFSSGVFGGEGFILQDVSGSGTVFLEIFGDKIVRELAPGEVLKVDTGNVVGFEKTVSYEIETVKGIKNIFLGGEGLFLTKLTGPGKVILQTQNFEQMAGRIMAMMPPSGN